jgi:predicted dehydrogenase
MNHTSISRRDAIRMMLATGAVAALCPSVAQAQEKSTPEKKVVMGFIGVGNRGTVLLNHVLEQNQSIEIPAICDIDQKNLNRALDIVEKSRGKRPEGYLKGPTDYRRLLERTDLNAVLIGTPQELHARMSIDALNAGKYVGAEVPAACTIDECWELVRTAQRTKVGYMMLENLIYTQPAMQILNMVQQGLFGDLTYGAGNYIHEIRAMRFKEDGSLTWRGENVRDNIGIIYPTHAIGPVARWMGINVDDTLKTLVAMDSRSVSNHQFAVKKFGADSPAAQVKFANGDTNHALIRTAKGRLIEIRYDTASPRPPGMDSYSLQGTKGAYQSAFGQKMIYLEGTTQGEKWEPLETYRSKYDHPRWAERAQKAASAGHGGSDYFVIEDFLSSIRSGKSAVDVYDAVTWSCLRPLSADSIRAGGRPIEIPDFKKAV